MSFNELEFLVDETFRINSSDLNSSEEINSLFNFEDDSVFIIPEETCGLFYKVDKKTSTFIVRCFASTNLKADYYKILDNPNNFPTLKIDEEYEVTDQLSYFECDNLILAQKIKTNICNKRFPLHEEDLFNVSDHSDHWWLNKSESGLSVSFKLRANDTDSVKIGALTDSKDLCSKLKSLYGYFKLLFPVGEYSLSESSFKISSTDSDNVIFKGIQDIFIKGEVEHGFWSYLMDLELRSSQEPYLEDLQKANFLLLELANTRKFWKQIEAKL